MKLTNISLIKSNKDYVDVIRYKDKVIWIRLGQKKSEETYNYEKETETITTLVGSCTYDLNNEQLTYTPSTNNSINYDSDDESLNF